MKLKICLAVIHTLLFAALVWLTWWYIAIVISAVAICATVYWYKKVEKFIGDFKATPPTVPPASPTEPDAKEFGSYLSRGQSVFACLAGIGLALGALTLLILYLVGSWSLTYTVGAKIYTLKWFPILLIPTGLYIAMSFQEVGSDQNAVKSFFGHMFEDVGSGLTFVPLWACKLTKVTSKVITLAGGTPEWVKSAERGEKAGATDSDKFLQAQLVQSDEELLRSKGGTLRVGEEATRVTFAQRGSTAKYFGDDEKEFKNSTSPLGAQMTIDPKVVLSLLIPKSGVRRLVRRFGTTYAALREIDEMMTSHLQVLCSRITAEYFVYRVDDVALMLQLILEKLLGDEILIGGGSERPVACLTSIGVKLEAIQSLGYTGVDVKSLRIETGLPKGVNMALKTVVETDIAKQSAANTAAANRITLTEAGEGNAAATKAMKLAEAAGVEATKKAEAAGKEAMLRAEAAGRAAIIATTDNLMGRLLVQLETAENALSKTDKVIIAPNGGDVLGAIASIRETLKALEEQDRTKASNPAPLPTPTAPSATT